MPGQARAKSVGSKNRSRAWSIRRIDVHYRSVAGRFSATSHRRQVRSALNPHYSSGPWRKWWDGAPSVARWDCLPIAPMLGSRMAEPARSQVVCRTSIAPRADCQCAHSTADPLMGAACGGTTVSYAVTRSVRRMSPEGRIHLLGGVKSRRSTGNSRGARCQCRLCILDRTSGVTQIVLHESRLLIDPAGIIHEAA